MSAEDGYLLDNAQAEAGRRFDALAALFDASTFRHLQATGLGVGWRVWEVGAGGTSVASWLTQQVGPTGRVVASDIDTSWTSGPRDYEVIMHDVGRDDPPGHDFDLVHARLVLVHVPERERALATMVAALRPGGRLVVEDADPALQPLVCLDDTEPAAQLANRLKRGFRTLLAERGRRSGLRAQPAPPAAGGRAARRRRRRLLPDHGPANDELERATTEQLRDRLVAAGLATPAEIDEHLANVRAGILELATSAMITAWGCSRGGQRG